MIIACIEALFQSFDIICIFHCYRKANQAADFLAYKDCNPSTIMSSPNFREFHATIRNDDLAR